MKQEHTLTAKIAAAELAIETGIQRHGLTVLQFSGGKDSIACLMLARKWWDKVVVIWASASDDYPETVALMQEVKAMVPNFLVIRGNADFDQVTAGYPVDMLPQNSTPFGRDMDARRANPKLRLRYECCSENVWLPMAKAVRQTGARLVIRGQRDDERLQNFAATSGVQYDGIAYLLPIHDWTEQEVFAYLRQSGFDIPRQYAYKMPSGDCLHCTAYLHENSGKLRYLKDHHPTAAVEFERRLRVIQAAQAAETDHLAAMLSSSPATLANAGEFQEGAGLQ